MLRKDVGQCQALQKSVGRSLTNITDDRLRRVSDGTTTVVQ